MARPFASLDHVSKGRAGKYGRKPVALKMLPGINVFIGETTVEANILPTAPFSQPC